MLYLTCTTITSVDLAHYGVSRAKDWVTVDCGTHYVKQIFLRKENLIRIIANAILFTTKQQVLFMTTNT